MSKIAIIDYGMSNSYSVLSMINRLGRNAKIVRDTSQITDENKFILPGVGSFDNAILNLKKYGWFDYLKQLDFINKNYLLGFCIGMQVLFEKSEEGQEEGLNLIKGKVTSLTKMINKESKIPIMGWRKVKFTSKNSLIDGISSGTKFYFVHSYCCIPTEKDTILGCSENDNNYPCIINYNKIYATQFHTEKSHKNGMKLMKNFLDLK